MSDDEVFALIVCLAGVAFGWGRWAVQASLVRRLDTLGKAAALPWLYALVSAGVLLVILITAASRDVRGSAVYLAFYMTMGGAVTAAGLGLLGILGLSLRDEVIERRNPAVSIAWSGAVVGLTLAYAGGNIGDGPGWWVVVFSAGLAMATLLVGWIIVGGFGGAREKIVVERDATSALRVAGWFVAAGAITGRGAAGDWVSAETTVLDFAPYGAMALSLSCVAMLQECFLRNQRASRASYSDGRFLSGVVPLAGWLGVALIVLLLSGCP